MRQWLLPIVLAIGVSGCGGILALNSQTLPPVCLMDLPYQVMGTLEGGSLRDKDGRLISVEWGVFHVDDEGRLVSPEAGVIAKPGQFVRVEGLESPSPGGGLRVGYVAAGSFAGCR